MGRAAAAAARVLASLDQQATDRIAEAVYRAGYAARVRLARMACEETRLGVLHDKVWKNILATRHVWQDIQHLVTVGVVREDREPLGLAGDRPPGGADLRRHAGHQPDLHRALQGPRRAQGPQPHRHQTTRRGPPLQRRGSACVLPGGARRRGARGAVVLPDLPGRDAGAHGASAHGARPRHRLGEPGTGRVQLRQPSDRRRAGKRPVFRR